VHSTLQRGHDRASLDAVDLRIQAYTEPRGSVKCGLAIFFIPMHWSSSVEFSITGFYDPCRLQHALCDHNPSTLGKLDPCRFIRSTRVCRIFRLMIGSAVFAQLTHVSSICVCSKKPPLCTACGRCSLIYDCLVSSTIPLTVELCRTYYGRRQCMQNTRPGS